MELAEVTLEGDCYQVEANDSEKFEAGLMDNNHNQTMEVGTHHTGQHVPFWS